jgi:predicted nucleic acid-binding protein
MVSVLLDTTAVIDLLRGAPGATTRLSALEAAGDLPHVCAITAEEVSTGLRPREREAASRMFEGLGVAPLGVSEGRLAGWWRREHRSKGRALAQADALIAAAAVSIGARLVTGNPKDFERIPGLAVEHWPSGE